MKAWFVLFPVILIFMASLPSVLGGCTCEKDAVGDDDKTTAMRYKLVAIASILAASAVGVCLPMVGKALPALSPERNTFFLIKAFAAGVILATGFIHVLPDAFEHLTSPCLSETPWEFPFTGFVAMMAAIVTLMTDAFAMSYFKKAHSGGEPEAATPSSEGDEEMNIPNCAQQVDIHTHGHSHGSADRSGSSELLRYRVISQMLELGIVVHSVIIGISLGASESPKTIRPLVAALTFHQFFEGMGLGGSIAQAKFKLRAATIMAIFFSLTTPMGIAIGMGISKQYDENSTTALVVEGILNAASAGILIYMALVDLLAADFMSPKVQNNGRLQIGVNVFLLFGAGCMSLLAIWA